MNSYSLPGNVDALFITNGINIRYLCDFQGMAGPNERESFLLITKNQWYLLTFQMFENEAKKALIHHPHIQPIYLHRGYTLSQALSDIHISCPINVLGVENQSITLYEYQTLKKALPSLTFVDQSEWIEPLRLIKNQQEIDHIHHACQVTDTVLAAIQQELTLGISEYGIALRIEQLIKNQGLQLSFPPIVAFNEHSAIPHHKAGEMVLTKDSLILIDFGASYLGYCADITRVICMGNAKDEWKTAYNTVKKAHDDAIAYINSTGLPDGSEADRIARKVITDGGYPSYPHGLGHGLGLEIHENPRLSFKANSPLTQHMVFTIEPGLYLPEQFGIRLEDTVVLTDQGVKLLTNSPFILC